MRVIEIFCILVPDKGICGGVYQFDPVVCIVFIAVQELVFLTVLVHHIMDISTHKIIDIIHPFGFHTRYTLQDGLYIAVDVIAVIGSNRCRIFRGFRYLYPGYAAAQVFLFKV